MKSHFTRAWLAYPESPDQPVYDISSEEQWIGRGEGCHILLDDRYVSKRQAKVYWKANLLILEDYGHNPILLNGEPIREVMLKDGDRLTIGRSEFVVRIQPAPMEQSEVPVGSYGYSTPKVASDEDSLGGAGKSIKEGSLPGRRSIKRFILVILLALILCAALLYGVFFAYQKVLKPLRKRHVLIEKPYRGHPSLFLSELLQKATRSRC